MAAESSSDEESDPVVQEVDVCLAKALSEKLFLFQYPVRPASMTYESTPHLECRMKPLQQKIELELGMDVSSPSYCYSRGEQIADAVDRGNENQRPVFPSRLMDRHVLSSVCASEDNTKYASAVYHNGILHITPIKGVVQLRPGFHYFDKAEENQKKAAVLAHEDSQSEEEEEAKPIQLRFETAGAKQKVFDSVIEEKWKDMTFFHPHEQRSLNEKHLLYCLQDNFEAPEFTATSRDYLKILSPKEDKDYNLPADLPYGMLSLLKLKNMEFRDQIKALLVTTKVMQFSHLCALLGGGMDEQIVLKGVAQYALLVQGCWVVKSEVLYPAGTKSHVSGIDAEKLWPSRDYVMLSFNRKSVLSRKEVAAFSKLPTEETREVLEQLARQRPTQGWMFRLNTDIDFLERHAEACAEQAVIWKHKYTSLVGLLNFSDDFLNIEWNATTFPGLFYYPHRKPNTPSRRSTLIGEKKETTQRRRTVSQSSSDGLQGKKTDSKKHSDEQSLSKARSRSKSQEDISIIVKEEHLSPVKTETFQVKKEQDSPEKVDDLDTNIQQTKVKNISLLIDAVEKLKAKKKLQTQIESDPEPENQPMETSLGEVDNVTLERDCIEIEVNDAHEENSFEIFIPPAKRTFEEREKPPSDIFLKELKKFCRETVLSGCLSLADLKEVLSVKQKEIGNILCTGVTDELLILCLVETGAYEVKLKWGKEHEKVIPEEKRRLFMYPELGEPHDKYRMVVMNMFENSLSVRRKEIIEKFNTVLNSQPTNHGYTKLLSEFCENHNGNWYLFGVYQTIKKYNL
ncbi:DNA-directed RNA polymerase III subunit RPC5 isoform X2 [Hydra vulgaris]|uniref:DNA-directed RNA polymerase III subunit RPC5 isoform X2 n=1 Tax=Hydra vulgaris TaxID=6087 RepID=A0ABM4CCF1_HYDVU